MKLRTILCPTDFSPSSDAALRYASTLAAESDAELLIIHVVDESAMYRSGYNGVGYIADLAEQMRADSQQRLGQVNPGVQGVRYRTRLLTGMPASTILSVAELEQVDLIVIGSHGRRGVSRLLMGSVAEAVMRGAPCPVLTIKDPHHTKHHEPLPPAEQTPETSQTPCDNRFPS